MALCLRNVNSVLPLFHLFSQYLLFFLFSLFVFYLFYYFLSFFFFALYGESEGKQVHITICKGYLLHFIYTRIQLKNEKERKRRKRRNERRIKIARSRKAHGLLFCIVENLLPGPATCHLHKWPSYMYKWTVGHVAKKVKCSGLKYKKNLFQLTCN